MSLLFKLVSASASSNNEVVNILKSKTCLLSARFIINSRVYPVIIDTSASVSFVPEYGRMSNHSESLNEEANLNVKLADGKIVHINQKLMAHIRPMGSSQEAKQCPFYISQRFSLITNVGVFEPQIEIREGEPGSSRKSISTEIEETINRIKHREKRNITPQELERQRKIMNDFFDKFTNEQNEKERERPQPTNPETNFEPLSGEMVGIGSTSPPALSQHDSSWLFDDPEPLSEQNIDPGLTSPPNEG